MAILDPVLNPLLQPLLNISPFWGIVVLAFVISVGMTLAYKFLTNQSEMKRLKERQKEFQAKMKSLRDKPEEMMRVQKEAMSTNMEYMKASFKPTLFTMIPILLVFGWMSAHLAFEPIYPGESYSITAQFTEGVVGDAELVAPTGTTLVNSAVQAVTPNGVTWNLKSSEGLHDLTVKLGNDMQTKEVLITQELKYVSELEKYDHSDIQSIQINYNKLKPIGDFSIFGWMPGWLGLYIIFSIIFSMGLRKVMNIH